MRQIIWKDERGVALPMAVLLLLVLTSLMLAFVSLAQTEPMIAKNHLLATQARAQAEAGFERAVWALSQGAIAKDDGVPIPTNAIDPDSMPTNGSVAPNYNGSVYMLSGATGGFEVTVTRTSTDERQVVAIGYAPGNTGPTRSRRRIEAIVYRPTDKFLNAPAPLDVKGNVDIGGSSQIDATLPQTDTRCGGNKVGVFSAGALAETSGASIKGQDGNTIPNQPTDYQQNATDPTAWDQMTLSATDFKSLRNLAKLNGTYFGPGYPNGTAASSPAWTGSVHFSASNQVKNGIVFVDTVNGNDIPTDPLQQIPSEFANVLIDGNPFIGDIADPNQFKGWIVVNGSLAIAGNMKINGLVYTVNDLTYNGTGTGEINGLAISLNIRDVTSTSISTDIDPDSTTVGNSRVKFNCANTRARRFLPPGFLLRAGTYREVSD